MQHTALCGQSGTAKHQLFAELIQFDIFADHGLLLIDLDGDATQMTLATTPASRIDDVILIDFGNGEFPPALNPLAGFDGALGAVAADNLVDTIRAISGYDSMATPDMDRTIYNTARAVMDSRGGTLLDMYQMLINDQARQEIGSTVSDPLIAGYWRDQFERLDRRDQAFVTKSTINKLEPLLADARIRNALCQNNPLIHLRKATETRKIVIVHIPQSMFGANKARMLAGLVLSQFLSVAQRRRGLLPFHAYLPQIRHFPGATIQQMLATLGSRNVSVTLGFDYLDGLGPARHAIMGNVGNWLIFRMGLKDAEMLQELFPWDNTANKIHELNRSELHMIVPFTKPIKSVTVISKLNQQNNTNAIVKRCRHFYCRPRAEIEPAILNKLGGAHENRHQASRKESRRSIQKTDAPWRRADRPLF